MRLKRVKIYGFKTFADRTEFNIEGGLVAVVGPNGCGKSNLVDAILWGLGEANARNLRAPNSQDVIFSGSSRRKSLGFAEVNLLFDNEDGSLPVPTSEVSITRRLTRAGESEYSINRQPCRQRDIYELLADSGLGRSGYAIVGQKEIDQALSASAEERRAWVDEAAGVVRYRTRKLDAQRRLAAARGHLERVEDILRELSTQREPLRREAEAARAYRSILDSLRGVERGLLIREVASAVREVDGLRESIEGSTRKVKAEIDRAEGLDFEVLAIGEAVSELEREMDAVRGLQQSSLTAVERAQAEVRLGEERLRGLDDLERTLRDETGSAAGHSEEAIREVETLKVDEARERQALDGLREQTLGADAELKALTAALKTAEMELGEARPAHQKLLRHQAEAAHRQERTRLVRRELAGIGDALPEIEAAAAEAEAERDRLEALRRAARTSLEQAESELAQHREQEAAEAGDLRKLLAERATIEGRKRGVEATIEAHEGLPQGPRAVLDAARSGILHGSYRPVGEAVSVGKELAVALETSLGAAANDLIVDDPSEAKSAVAYLKDKRLGRATFQPIPLMRPSVVTQDLQRVLREPGVVGRASELADCEPRDRPVIDSLLGRVVIVEDVDIALGLARTTGWSRLVTLDGEVVHQSGAVTGGIQSKGHYGLVQRGADLQELERQLKAIESQVAKLEKLAAGHRKGQDDLATQIVALREALKSASEEEREAADLARVLRQEHDEAIRSRAKLEREATGLRDADQQSPEPVDVAVFEAKREQAQDAFNRLSDRAQQSALWLREGEGRLQQAESRRKQAERRLEASGEAEEKRAKRLAGIEPERASIRAEIERQAAAKASAENASLRAQERLTELQAAKQAKLEQSLDLAEEAKSARSNATAIGEAVHQAELNRARADARRANALTRLVEDYSLDEDDALAQSDSIELPPDAASMVARLRRELKSMGDVNLGAIEAFDRLSERFDEMSAQQEDILGGIAQVEASIAQLDIQTRERFMSTFTQLQVTFGEFFVKLFGGGEGKISLSDSANVLDSGVDLEVTLPGKKRQALALLSGGERSLCATAFLFGLLKIKPSPLVVLDEVDAPLDGRNVERFADLLREFTDRIQFIVITHNHATIVRADVWLGVTMQEPGVSTLVPAKAPDVVAPLAEQAPESIGLNLALEPS